MCYKTSAKIEAISQDSTCAKFVDSVSNTIALESMIRDLKTKLSQARMELANLTQNTVKPDLKRTHRLTEEITALRADIMAAKDNVLPKSVRGTYKTE